jgi:hypothetical protein
MNIFLKRLASSNLKGITADPLQMKEVKPRFNSRVAIYSKCDNYNELDNLGRQ